MAISVRKADEMKIYYKITYDWIIENFGPTEYLESPLFYNNDKKVEIRLLKKWTVKGRQKYLSLTVQSQQWYVFKKIKLSVRDSGDSNIRTDYKTCTVSECRWEYFILESVLLPQLQDGVVKICVEILELVCSVTPSHQIEFEKGYPKNPLEKDFEAIFQSREFSDVTLVVQEKEIRAHRQILAVRSSVFSAMLQNTTAEKETGIIHISDFDFETMEQLICFVYTRKVDLQDETSVTNLLKAADKYAVEELRELCVDFIKENLNASNVIQTLVLSDDHNLTELKKYAMDYITSNHFKFGKIEAFEYLEKNRPRLLTECLVKMIVPK